MSLTTVDVAKLKANPYRRLREYPIDRTKVDALKESIQSTGFWGTIVARQRGQDFEIAFGHHRMVAIQELGLDQVDIIVRDLTNEQMIQMMSRENLEEWGSSAWVEMETIRATIEAYGRGEIEMPRVPTKTNITLVREAHPEYVQAWHARVAPPEHNSQRTDTKWSLADFKRPYTKLTVARFLGCINRDRDGLGPSFGCRAAFRALDLIELGLLEERELKGLTRTQMDVLVSGLMKIHRAELKHAKRCEEDVEKVKKAMERAETEAQREKQEVLARQFEKAAVAHKQAAQTKPKVFVQEAKQAYEDGEGVRDVGQRAQSLITPPRPNPKVHSVDDFIDRITKQLNDFKTGKKLNKDLEFLRHELKNDVTRDNAESLCKSLKSLITWAQHLCQEFSPDKFPQ